MIKNQWILLFILLLFAIITPAQAINPESLIEFERHRQSVNQTGMMVLGGWALGNIMTGSYGHFNTTGQTRYFHQMNAMWNVVNLGIATFGYLGASGADPMGMGISEIVREYTSFQNILLLNAGLDVAYMTAGFYLRERSKTASRPDMLMGFGNSIILQGAFLFVFDVVLFFIHRSNASVKLYPVLDMTNPDYAGFGLVIGL